ncbi:2-iminoacetate synthase ThiH [Campylobacter hyointestinalis]|uniref:2-iminoacetate synthase ThiH n=2 Tax=Campylobacter hyointestinalis TaxID=198 RepID=A0AAV6EFR4_CAMHY|nr:2-iminoacetate synthase ThiH [Campylobacter hyointestinalis]ANE34487.1 ThiGH complex, tyrosine lyase subunit ThiH [Campylobacter hyointestinalis subsp. lawsonii CCUG 27631]KAB0611081.1 2-iminoacetate synthase ThiH [Campylobacter hyointestinalis subsp. lawsonii]QKF69310.1 2-iminoacetate synthase [Campylobacter hyointestinalis subsp. lawsonii]RAZ26316.1 2-iminoacetate synthase ThiH [Campylobacter hyointestinalis subsp. lawsonii]RAZ27247.1 2-iminoacetate synthase ThiH [Campylobacter hyointesti
MRDRNDHMKYLENQEIIDHSIMDRILKEWQESDFDSFSSEDVLKAISNDKRTLDDFKALLSPAAAPFLEDIARVAMSVKERYFGKNIYLFTPLYIANHCDNNCVYCGFNVHNEIKRAQLDENAIIKELENIAKSGLQEILILTGESQSKTPVSYIGRACELAKRYFNVVGVEIYPLNSDDYAFLHRCGVDFVTVFQETYNPVKYEKIHLEGNKRIFPYRLNAQERALMGGMRGVAFAALLGIDDFRKDAMATGLHAYLLQSKYPHAEISISVPRLRPIINNKKINPRDVGEKELLQVIMAYRLFLPYANITLSTRENAHFRDHAIKLGVTKVSAGVSVAIGEHGGKKEDDKGDGQFEISDTRDVLGMKKSIISAGLTPVMSDYIYV